MSVHKTVPRSRMFTRALDLLRERPKNLTIQKIATDTGLTEAWLNYVLTTEAKACSVSVDRAEVLYEYLSKSKLIIQ